MRKPFIVAAIGFGILSLAGPAHAEDPNGDEVAEVSSYGLPPTGDIAPVAPPQAIPTPSVGSAGPVAQAAPAGELPVTGSSSNDILQLGAAAMLTGGGLVVVARQRGRKARPVA